MLGKRYDDQVCSIARALESVGERWTLLIMRNALFAGHTRFSEFQRSLGIATNVLSARLEGLVGDGLLERRQRADKPDGPEYVLTEKGRDLAPVLIGLTAWGDRWAAPDGPPIHYHHERCGGRLDAMVVCSGCGRVEELDEIEARPGPGMPAERAAAITERLGRRSR
jgi:DNA-binding HxlR family transcriptional regulator